MRFILLIYLFIASKSVKSDDIIPIPIPNIINDPNLLQIILPTLLESYQQQFVKFLNEIVTNLPNNDNSSCFQDLQFLRESLANREEWAMNMIDSWAKPQTGLFMGNIMHVGNFDECVSAGTLKENEEIRGMYCSVPIYPHEKYAGDLINNLPFWSENRGKADDNLYQDQRTSFAFCFPSSCTSKNLQDVFNYLEDSVKFEIHFDVDPKFCSTAGPKPFTTSAIIGLVIFILFVIVAVLSTIYDVFFYNKESGIYVLTAFSISTNLRKILSTKTPQDNLGCLNGMRVISMMWVLLGHRYMLSFLKPQINMTDIFLWKDSYENSIIAATFMAVETFFTISGLLLTYTFLKARDNGVTVSLPMFFIHRYLRLTPALLMVVVFSLTLGNYIGDGPFWPVVNDFLQKPCEKWWWSTLLYVQNYVNPDDECVGQSWFLSVDTQLYFLSPLFLFPLVLWPKRTIVAILVVILLSTGYAFEITNRKRLGTSFFDNTPDQFKHFYAVTHVRMVTYLIGAISGFIIFNTKKSGKVRICTNLVLILWAVALCICGFIIVAHTGFAKYEYNVTESAFFNAFARPSWAIALSLMIFLCVHRHGGLINSFLANGVFTILIRINYSMYLVHMIVLIYFIAQERNPSYFTNRIQLHDFWGDFAAVILVSLGWTLMFESPVLILEKALFKKRQKPSTGGVNHNTGTLPVYVQRSEEFSQSTVPAKIFYTDRD